MSDLMYFLLRASDGPIAIDFHIILTMVESVFQKDDAQTAGLASLTRTHVPEYEALPLEGQGGTTRVLPLGPSSRTPDAP